MEVENHIQITEIQGQEVILGNLHSLNQIDATQFETANRLSSCLDIQFQMLFQELLNERYQSEDHFVENFYKRTDEKKIVRSDADNFLEENWDEIVEKYRVKPVLTPEKRPESGDLNEIYQELLEVSHGSENEFLANFYHMTDIKKISRTEADKFLEENWDEIEKNCRVKPIIKIEETEISLKDLTSNLDSWATAPTNQKRFNNIEDAFQHWISSLKSDQQEVANREKRHFLQLIKNSIQLIEPELPADDETLPEPIEPTESEEPEETQEPEDADTPSESDTPDDSDTDDLADSDTDSPAQNSSSSAIDAAPIAAPNEHPSKKSAKSNSQVETELDHNTSETTSTSESQEFAASLDEASLDDPATLPDETSPNATSPATDQEAHENPASSDEEETLEELDAPALVDEPSTIEEADIAPDDQPQIDGPETNEPELRKLSTDQLPHSLRSYLSVNAGKHWLSGEVEHILCEIFDEAQRYKFGPDRTFFFDYNWLCNAPGISALHDKLLKLFSNREKVLVNLFPILQEAWNQHLQGQLAPISDQIEPPIETPIEMATAEFEATDLEISEPEIAEPDTHEFVEINDAIDLEQSEFQQLTTDHQDDSLDLSFIDLADEPLQTSETNENDPEPNESAELQVSEESPEEAESTESNEATESHESLLSSIIDFFESLDIPLSEHQESLSIIESSLPKLQALIQSTADFEEFSAQLSEQCLELFVLIEALSNEFNQPNLLEDFYNFLQSKFHIELADSSPYTNEDLLFDPILEQDEDFELEQTTWLSLLLNFSQIKTDPDSESDTPTLEQFLELLEENFPELNEILEKHPEELTIKIYQKLQGILEKSPQKIYEILLKQEDIQNPINQNKQLSGLQVISLVTKILKFHKQKIGNLNSVLIDLGIQTSLSIDDISQWAATNKQQFISTKPTKQSQLRIATTGAKEFLLILDQTSPLYFSVFD